LSSSRPVAIATLGVMAVGLLGIVGYQMRVAEEHDLVIQTAEGGPLTQDDRARAMRAAALLLDGPRRIDVVKGSGEEVLQALYPDENVFGDTQDKVGSGDLLVVNVPNPTRNVDYSRPPGVERREIVSALLVIDDSGTVIASELSTVEADPAEQLRRVNRIGHVDSMTVDPSVVLTHARNGVAEDGPAIQDVLQAVQRLK
jgi:hypothetical protein